MISAKPNTPIATLVKPMPSDSSAISKVMRPAPVSRSEPTIESSRPVKTMATDLSTEPFASTTAKMRPSTISAKYSAGPNSSARPVSGAPSAATSTVDTQPAKNEPMAAIEAGDPRGRLAGDFDQPRGGGAAILGTIIDAGQHDERTDRRQAEGDRQQHGHRRYRADAGQHADQRPDQGTDQAKADIVGISCDLETEREIGEKFCHDTAPPLSTSARVGTAAAAGRRTAPRRMPP